MRSRGATAISLLLLAIPPAVTQGVCGPCYDGAGEATQSLWATPVVRSPTTLAMQVRAKMSSAAASRKDGLVNARRLKPIAPGALVAPARRRVVAINASIPTVCATLRTFGRVPVRRVRNTVRAPRL